MCVRKSQGTTLIELMICLALSFVILTGLWSAYLTAKQNFHLQTKLASLQETVQTTFQILTRDITAAGFMGCARFTPQFPLVNHTSFNLQASHTLEIESHILTTRHMDWHTSALLQPMTDKTLLVVDREQTYAPADIVMLSDCQSADVFIISQVRQLANQAQQIMTSTPISKFYGSDAYLSRLISNTYYRKQSTLYVKSIHGHSVALADFIDGLEFKSMSHGVAIHLRAGDATLHKDWYTYVAY